jgi:hypothetical protein
MEHTVEMVARSHMSSSQDTSSLEIEGMTIPAILEPIAQAITESRAT